LRVKGILKLSAEPAPVAIHGVHHVFHPPVALSEWPDADRRSRIVFITRGITRQEVFALCQAGRVGWRTYCRFLKEHQLAFTDGHRTSSGATFRLDVDGDLHSEFIFRVAPVRPGKRNRL
jgi:hypothetical protein